MAESLVDFLAESERRYTLSEAQRILAARSCEVGGHDWTVIEAFGGQPKSIVCSGCGAAHRIAVGDGDTP